MSVGIHTQQQQQQQQQHTRIFQQVEFVRNNDDATTPACASHHCHTDSTQRRSPSPIYRFTIILKLRFIHFIIVLVALGFNRVQIIINIVAVNVVVHVEYVVIVRRIDIPKCLLPPTNT
jgi:hypothetical protein